VDGPRVAAGAVVKKLLAELGFDPVARDQMGAVRSKAVERPTRGSRSGRRVARPAVRRSREAAMIEEIKAREDGTRGWSSRCSLRHADRSSASRARDRKMMEPLPKPS